MPRCAADGQPRRPVSGPNPTRRSALAVRGRDWCAVDAGDATGRQLRLRSASPVGAKFLAGGTESRIRSLAPPDAAAPSQRPASHPRNSDLRLSVPGPGAFESLIRSPAKTWAAEPFRTSGTPKEERALECHPVPYSPLRVAVRLPLYAWSRCPLRRNASGAIWSRNRGKGGHGASTTRM